MMSTTTNCGLLSQHARFSLICEYMCAWLYIYSISSATRFDHLPPDVQDAMNSRPNTPSSPGAGMGRAAGARTRLGTEAGTGGLLESSTSSSHSIAITPMGSISGPGYGQLPLLRKTSSFSSSSFNRWDDDTVNSNSAADTNDTDLESRRILKAVENEFKHWWNAFP